MPTNVEVDATLLIDNGSGGTRAASVNDLSNGTDGSSPPSLPNGSTGVRGWLRLVYNTLTALAGQLPASLSNGRLKTEITQAAGTSVLVEPSTGAEFALADTTFDVASLPLPDGASSELTLAGFKSANHTDLAAILAAFGSTSHGNGKLPVAGASTLLSSVSGGIPAGATKALLLPDAAMTINDDGTAADANDFPLAANREWRYDGNLLSQVRFYGTGNVYVWFYA